MDIESIRKERGLSQKALAELLGYTQSAISRIEKGEVAPSSNFLLRLENYLEQPLEAGARTPRRSPRSTLQGSARWLKRAFEQPTYLPQVLRIAFAAARCSQRGHLLVEELDGKKHQASVWKAIRHLAGFLNSPEQLFFLHCLVDDALVIEANARDTCFPRRYAVDPNNWNLAFRRDRCVYFPQLTLLLDENYAPRLDFLVSVPTEEPLHINLEFDGHQHDAEEDARRERRIGLPTLRIPIADLEREDFLLHFDRKLANLIKKERGAWVLPPRRPPNSSIEDSA